MRIAPGPHASHSALLFLLASLLTGCALQSDPSAPVESSAQSLTGSIHGGQQPVSAAHIYIFQAATTAYGAASINIGSPAVAVTRGGGSDSLGAYFISDANGAFAISNAYTCTAGRQIYLLVTGGNPGLGAGKTNPALALMAVLGACPALQTFQYAVPSLQVNELTTVAAVYALAGFLSNGAHVAAGPSTLASTGLANAFLNAPELVSLSSGVALDTTPNGLGLAPAAKVRTLADILAACVNTDGTGTPCSTLFTSAPNAAGTLPTDTVTALVNIAHNPSANVSALLSLVTAASPFQPTLASLTDLTLSIAFSSGGAAPGTPAVDSSGSLWLPDTDSNTLSIVDPRGNPSSRLSPLGGVFGGSIYYITPPAVAIDPYGFGWVDSTSSGILEAYSPSQGAGVANGAGMQFSDSSSALAIDAQGNVFVADATSRLVAVFDNNGNPLSGATGFANGFPWNGLALDHTSRFFVADSSDSYIAGFNASGTAATFSSGLPAAFNGGGLSAPSSLAFDSANNLWVTNGNSSLSEFNVSTGAILTPSAITGGGLSFNPAAQPIIPIAIDGAGTPWVPNFAGQSISHFSAAGAALSPSVGFVASGCAARGLALDPSGNVWVTCTSSTRPLLVFLGAATPVVAPLAPATAGTLP